MASTGTQQAVASPASAQTSPDETRQRRLEDLGLIMLVGFAPLVVAAVYLLFVPLQLPAGYVNFRFLSGLTYEIATLSLFLCLMQRQGRALRTIGLTFHWTDIPTGLGLFLLSYLGATFSLGALRSHISSGTIPTFISGIQHRCMQEHPLFCLLCTASQRPSLKKPWFVVIL